MNRWRDIVVLLMISVTAGLCLSVVHISTSERIEEMKRRELQNALKQVLPFMTSNYEKVLHVYHGETVTIYSVTKCGEIQGAAVEMVTNEGFSGNIIFLMGVDRYGKIVGFYLLDHKETPGLGTKASDRRFWGQFIGQDLNRYTFKVKKDMGDVDAITSATITSRAISHAMEKGLRIFHDFLNTRSDV